ncbi:MAG TPA: GxxExxY protein [Candidatus Saccharimonadia bacterium]|nr:GxxExxY protein [Candidatus Saccharimonadia bacterium]
MRSINELCNLVRQTACDIHLYHGHGHLEKVYENALVHRLRKLGLLVGQQQPVSVLDEDGTVVGEYFTDLLIEGVVLVELKAVTTLLQQHAAQLLGYLKSTRIEHGLLMNFGSYKFQIKKYALSQSPPTGSSRSS